MKKSLSELAMIIGAVIAVIGILADAFSYGESIPVFNIIDLSSVAAILAIAFVFGKDSDKAFIGYLIAVILGASALTEIIMETEFGIISVGYAIMGLASVVYYFIKFIAMLGFVKKDKTEN